MSISHHRLYHSYGMFGLNFSAYSSFIVYSHWTEPGQGQGTGNKWVVEQCVEAFTLHLNSEGLGPIVSHCSVPALGPVPGPGSIQCE